MNDERRGKDLMLWVLTILLLIFTGLRNVHLIQTTLPPDWAIVGYVALAALDGGVILWTNYYSNNAVGAQKTVAALMVAVDYCGMVAGLLADTFLVGGGDEGLVRMVSLWVVPIVIGLNVLGKLGCVMLDPHQAIRAAQADAEQAGLLSQAAVYKALAEQRRSNAEQTAAEVAPEMWAKDRASLVAKFAGHQNGVKDKASVASLLGNLSRREEASPVSMDARDITAQARVVVKRPSRRLANRVARAKGALSDGDGGPK